MTNIRDPTQDEISSSPTKDDLKKQIEDKDVKIHELKRKVKSLQRAVQRDKQKVSKRDNIIEDLRQQNLVSSSVANVLEENFSGVSFNVLMNHFVNKDRKPQGHRHNDEAKKFAMTLHFYSPRAFEYVRKIFDLPHPRSIRAWTSSVECAPGFFKKVFDRLRGMVEADPINADCALIFDGMSIRQAAMFNRCLGRMLGFVDYGEGIIPCSDEDDEDDTIASEALIFMISSLRAHWKYPIGFVFCNKIKANEQYSLVSRALDSAVESGLNVQKITCDGTSTNFSTMRKFGCELGKTLDDLDGEFTYKGNTYLFTPDMPHMLKLSRNALNDMKTFTDADGNKIEWRFIEQLHEEQQKDGLKYGGNKLSKEHVQYHRHKMNVRLAAQTLSSSVADAIEYFQISGDPAFQGADATIKFIRIIDRLFDLLNSRNKFGKGFKSPMHLGNFSVRSSVIDESIEYLVGLKDSDGKSLLKNRRHTFVKGMVIGAKSAKRFAQRVLNRANNPYAFVLTYKWSQDLIELLNSCIRGRGGNNNNPNVEQFISALKKILLHASITASKYANCLEFETDSSPPIFSLTWSKNRKS